MTIKYKEIDGMVYYSEIDKWITIEEHKDFIAKKLQQKIANDYGFDKFIDGLAEKNGITNY